MKRLLLISCSATKREGASLPAIARYDGPKFRVLRKALAEGIDPPTIRILSACYGLIEPDRIIDNYNLELSPRMVPMFRQVRTYRGDFDQAVLAADDIFVMAGGLYCEIIDLWLAEAPPPTKPTRWRVCYGAPGQRLQQLGAWLREGAAS